MAKGMKPKGKPVSKPASKKPAPKGKPGGKGNKGRPAGSSHRY